MGFSFVKREKSDCKSNGDRERQAEDTLRQIK